MKHKLSFVSAISLNVLLFIVLAWFIFKNETHLLQYLSELSLGDHAIDVRIDGESVVGSPYLVKVYDSSRVKVTDVGSGVVGKPVYFSSM